MSPSASTLRPSALAPALVAGGAGAALVVALLAQHWGGLAPCLLCLWQRWALWAVVALGMGGIVAALFGRARLAGALTLLAGVAALGSAGIAFFHVGVEQHWWTGTSGCGASLIDPRLTAEELRTRIEAAPMVRCDQVAWSLFGLSMAAYNLLYSTMLGAAGVALGWRLTRNRSA